MVWHSFRWTTKISSITMPRTLINNKLHQRIDLLGVILSVACGIHCVALPVLIVILPLIGLSFILNETLEKVFVIATVCLAAFNLCWGYSIHKKIRVLFIFLAASIMLISGIFILPHSHTPPAKHAPGHGHHSHTSKPASPIHQIQNRPQGNSLSLIILVIGAAAISTSHLINRRLCKSCLKCKTGENH